MVNALLEILGFGSKTDYKALKEAGAIVIDVRSKREFQSGHVKNSTNIPLEQIESRVDELKNKKRPIITCCFSGARSGAAKNKLKAAGIKEVYNGGSWSFLETNLK